MSRFVIHGLLSLLLLASNVSATEPAALGTSQIERLPAIEPPVALEELPPTEAIAEAKDQTPTKETDKPVGGEDAKTDKKDDDASKEEGKAADSPPAIPTVVKDVVVSEVDAWLDWFSPGAAEAVHQWCNPWSGSFEMGVDGSAGNSDTFNIRLGLDAKRKTEAHTITLDLDYHKNTNDGLETANRLFFDWRYERPYKKTPWTWFIQGTTTYDEFQPWDVRVNAATGFGYRWIETEATTLTTRFGGGSSHEIGGPDDSYVPELTFGADMEHQLSKRQKIKASVEYYPDVTEFGDFRLIGKGDWEVLLDEEMNLSLKLSVADRFKRPNTGGKLNDIDYSLTLLWKF